MVLHAPLAPMWRPLPALRCRRALLARAAKAPDAPENAALACIRRAKQAAGKLPLDAAQAAPPLASTLPVPGTDVVARFESAAQAAASEEERAFLGALSARPEQPAAARGAPAASAPPLPVKGTSPAALRARLAKAREYRAKAKPAPQAAGGAAPAAGQAPSAVAGAEAQPGAQPAMAAAGGSAEQVGTCIWCQHSRSEPLSLLLAAFIFFCSLRVPACHQAAGFLRDVLESGAAADAGVLSPEQFTLKREAEQRSRGAELITIDASAKQEAAGAAYRPKVATWGVFPRPANISREFGGGRTIQPGQALEPEEVREARKARVAAAMAAYRKDQVGLGPGAQGRGSLARRRSGIAQLTLVLRATAHAWQALRARPLCRA